MASYINFNDPVRITWRSGKTDDPYVDKTETLKVINNTIVLHEIPYEFNHVTISGYVEVSDDKNPASNEFVVDYQNGLITFNSTEEGKSVTATYKGRGYIQYPAERIYAHRKDEPSTLQNLQEIIDNSQAGIDSLAQVSEAINKAVNLGGLGTYDNAKLYKENNIVFYNGATYINIQDSTGIAPPNTSYWQFVASNDWTNLINKPTSTVANIDDAVTKRHSQNTDTTLTGSGINVVNTTGAGNIVDFKVSGTVRSSIDNTGKFTGTIDWSNVNSKPTSTIANIDDAVTKKHSQNTDTTLTGSGINVINTTGAGNIVDFKVGSVVKSSIDTTGKFTGKIDWANVNNIPTSTVANIDDAVTKRHSQNTDTTLTGSGINTINTTGVGNVVDFKVGGTVRSSIDNTGKFTGSISGSADGNAGTATKLQTARNISISGDTTASVQSFDGSANIVLSTTLANSGVTAGTYTKLTVDAKGRVTVGASLAAGDIPALDWTKITTGKPTTRDGYGITDVYLKTDVDTSLATKLNTSGGTLTGFLILNADPTQAFHAVTKQYADALKENRDVKDSVKAATTANIVLSGLQTIDTVSLIAGDRILVKDQTNSQDNGIYIVSSGSWTRSTDADTSAKVTTGMFTFVEQGVANGSNGFSLLTTGSITLGTTPLSFTQTSGAGQIATGAGITKVGNTLSLTSGVATAGTYKSVTVDTYGRVTAGTNPTTLTGYGITDAATLTHAHSLTVNGDVSGTVSLDNTADTMSLTLASVGTAGTYTKVTTDAQGRVTSGTSLVATDIPSLDWAKITTGKPTTLSGYGITDGATLASPALTGIPTAPTAATVTNTTQIATTAFVKAQGYLTANQTITLTGDITGSGTTSIATTLKNTGTAGTYTKVTTDAQGRVTSGTTAAFDDLSDVIISSPNSSHVLNFNGTNWVNSPTPNAKAFLNEGYKTAKSTAANQWTKIASISLTAQNQVATTRIALAGGLDGGASGTSPIANIFFRVAQVAAMASAPVVGVRLMENQNISISEITAVTSTNTAGSTVVDLYVKIVDINETFVFVPTMINGNVTYYESQSLLTTLPAGTQTASVYDTVDALALPIATSSAYGAVKVTAGNGLSYTSDVITHTTGAGYNHIPTGGASGNFLKWSSSGVATWISLVAADIPALDWTKITTGKPTTATGYGLVLTATDIPVLDWSKITTGKPTTLSGYGITDAMPNNANATTTGTLTVSGGTLTLNNGTSNVIKFGGVGFAPPNGTGTSTGTRLNFWSDGSFGIGIESNSAWYTAFQSHKWYTQNAVTNATPTNVMTLDGTGNLSLNGTVTASAFTGNASTSTKWATARSISMTGDGTWTIASIDGTANVTAAMTLKNTGTAGTYTKVTTDAQGRVTSGTTLVATDIPNLDWAKITTSKPTTLSGYGITDAQKNISKQSTAPLTPSTDDLWLDTSVTPNVLKRYDGATWQQVGGSGSGGLTSVTSANSDISVANTTTSPVLTLNSGSSANQIVKMNASAQIVSTVATGTAPLVVASTTLVTNLNSDLLDGMNSSSTATSNTIVSRDASADITSRRGIFNIATGTSPFVITSTTVNTNLNADMVDGYHFDQSVKLMDTPSFLRLSISETTLAPFNVNSTARVVNLNADMVDGYHASVGTSANTLVVRDAGSWITSAGFTSSASTGTAPFTVASTTAVINLNADMLDGLHSSSFALLASPALTGTPTAPTAAVGTNTTQIATTAFVLANSSSSSSSSNWGSF